MYFTNKEYSLLRHALDVVYLEPKHHQFRLKLINKLRDMYKQQEDITDIDTKQPSICQIAAPEVTI